VGAAGAATVRRIRADEGPALRTLRVAALSSDPLAFGSTLEREESLGPEHWEERARDGSAGGTEAIFLLADSNRLPHGMVGAFTDNGTRHLWGMWVAPTRRKEGGGDALLRAVLSWCRENPGVGPVALDINPQQVGALRMYERHGFRKCGDERPLGHSPPAQRFAMELVDEPESRRPEP
jgi:GNAT superfamily N-acetyltransferase